MNMKLHDNKAHQVQYVAVLCMLFRNAESFCTNGMVTYHSPHPPEILTGINHLCSEKKRL